MVELNTLLPCAPECTIFYERYYNALTKDFLHQGDPPAVLFLDEFDDITDYISKISFNKRYGYRKARKLGYFVEPFYFHSFIGDVIAINTSKAVRAGGPMRPAYLETVDQRGGYLKTYRQIQAIQCYKHFSQDWGVFKIEKGYKQGDVVVNRRLYAYISIIVMGEYSLYSMIIGHGDYLKDEIMTILHIEVVNYLKKKTPARYLEYHTYKSGSQGLQDWKRYFLFQPTPLWWAVDK